MCSPQLKKDAARIAGPPAGKLFPTAFFWWWCGGGAVVVRCGAVCHVREPNTALRALRKATNRYRQNRIARVEYMNRIYNNCLLSVLNWSFPVLLVLHQRMICCGKVKQNRATVNAKVGVPLPWLQLRHQRKTIHNTMVKALHLIGRSFEFSEITAVNRKIKLPIRT